MRNSCTHTMDEPEVLHDICRFVTDVYKEQLDGILKIVTPSLVILRGRLKRQERPHDLSGYL